MVTSSTNKGVNQRSIDVTDTQQQQRPESSTLTLTWHASKDSRYINCTRGTSSNLKLKLLPTSFRKDSAAAAAADNGDDGNNNNSNDDDGDNTSTSTSTNNTNYKSRTSNISLRQARCRKSKS